VEDSLALNLLLLLDADFVDVSRVRLSGRRRGHVVDVHRAAVGDTLAVGRLGGLMGTGRVVSLDDDAIELDVELHQHPPAKLPLTLVLALPRPKVLNRALAAATSLGVERIVLVNAWKVEKSYWKSPRMAEENLVEQRLLGLEQAKDTILPELVLARLFRPFVERELPALTEGRVALVAHPHAPTACPRAIDRPCVLAIGPEGGWIPAELQSLEAIEFQSVDLGPRILRVETAVAALVGRLF
jgi:16S rRNA (uracil1498-N3)-methyltransferase